MSKFLGMLLSTLGGNLLENLLAGRHDPSW